MTTSVKVTACCGPNKEVVFGIQIGENHSELVDVSIIQDGESIEKYVYDHRQAVSFEREKE